jgi:hypothetical protein
MLYHCSSVFVWSLFYDIDHIFIIFHLGYECSHCILFYIFQVLYCKKASSYYVHDGFAITTIILHPWLCSNKRTNTYPYCMFLGFLSQSMYTEKENFKYEHYGAVWEPSYNHMLGTPQWTDLRPVQGIGTISKTRPRWYNKTHKVTKGSPLATSILSQSM